MLKVYAAKATHENGACWTYWVFGGNSKNLETGYPARDTPSKGAPSSIAARIMNLNIKLLMADINMLVTSF